MDVETITVIAVILGAITGIARARAREQEEKVDLYEVETPPMPEEPLTQAELKAMERWFRD